MTWFFSPIKSTDKNTALFPRLILIGSTPSLPVLTAVSKKCKKDISWVIIRIKQCIIV